jgi:hypothetical protein
MVDGLARTESGKRVACLSGFTLEGVHRFESPGLSDMSIACLRQSSCRKLNKLNGLICN